MDIAQLDLINIQLFASRVIDMFDYRKRLHEYLHSKINQVAPNLSSLIGDQVRTALHRGQTKIWVALTFWFSLKVAARLISHAGSLTNLAKYPASTIQILGAEKALFRYVYLSELIPLGSRLLTNFDLFFSRALKTKSNTPKYGLIFHSSFIGRAGSTNKGRISRYLANKCAIASRIDCFTGELLSRKLKRPKPRLLMWLRWFFALLDVPTTVFGEVLQKQVEDRLKFYDSGSLPPKNAEVMAQAVLKAEEAKNEILKREKKKKKDKKKKSKKEGDEEAAAMETEEANGTNGVDKNLENLELNGSEDESAKKKKKKSKNKEWTSSAQLTNQLMQTYLLEKLSALKNPHTTTKKWKKFVK